MLSGERVCVCECVCVCVCVGEEGRSHYSRRTDGGGEPWRRMHVAFLFKVITTRLQLHPELCLPPSSSSLLFTLYSDELLLFRHTVWMPVWLEVLWHQTHLLYLTEMPNAAVSDDWQARTPVSATCLSSSLSNGRAALTARCQKDETQRAEWQSVWRISNFRFCLNLAAFVEGQCWFITTWVLFS